MFQIPKKKRAFELRFEKAGAENTEAENKNERAAPSFQVPDNAEYKLVNTVPGYVTTLVEGQLPDAKAERDAKLAETESGDPNTRQAILFAHTKIDPLNVPHDQWVLHDGSSLTQGTANCILLHRPSAELMHNWDVVYKISPHPRKAGEIAIREIYLCPVGTAETCTSDANAPLCTNCARPASFACKCQAAQFCSAVCREGAARGGAHDEDDCLREYAAGLVERSAHERERAIEAAKAEEEKQDEADPDADADADDKKGR